MDNKEKGAVIGVFGVVFVLLFMYFTKADLPTLLRGLDRFKVPSKVRTNSSHKREPLVTIIGQGQRAEDGLIQILDDAERPEAAKIGATIALGQIKSGKSVNALVKHLDNDTKKLNKFVAVALKKIGPEAQGALDRYTETASGSPVKGRIGAMYALALFGSSSRTLGLLERTIRQDKDAKVREAAVFGLDRINGPGAAKVTAIATQDSDQAVREAADLGLKRRPTADLVRAATELIRHAKPQIRKLAVLLVRKVTIPGAYAPLEKGLQDTDLEVACTAAPGFARWFKTHPQARGPFVGRLRSLLAQAKTQTQLMDLGRATANGKVVELVDFFLGWLGSGETSQRLAACAALAETAPKSQNGRIIPQLAHADPAVRKAVHRCLLRLLERARKSQPGLHRWVKRGEPRADKAWWDRWWKSQQRIYKLSDDADELCRVARKKIKTLKSDQLLLAKKLLEEAREMLIKIAEITGTEPSRRIQNIQKDIATTIYHGGAVKR